MSLTIKSYTPQLFWDDRAGYWVAELREIPTCSADGATPAEAVSNLEATFAVLKEAYTEEDTPLPAPEQSLPIQIAALERMSALLNLSNLARRAGFSPQTLASKLKRKTEFTLEESRRIAEALRLLSTGATVTAAERGERVREPAGKYRASAQSGRRSARRKAR